ncbi:hypothetical protein JCM12298_27890 [Desulfothermus naphthae]
MRNLLIKKMIFLFLICFWVAGPFGMAKAMVGAPPNTITVTFNDFSNSSNLQLNGNASITNGILRLTPDQGEKRGSAFYKTPIFISDYFSTKFTFQIHDGGYNGQDRGDGFAFVAQISSNGTSALGAGGGGLGYKGISPSIAVEFDTFKNDNYSDPSKYHVGLDLNGNMTSVKTTDVVSSSLYSNNSNRYAWIDYDEGWIKVYLSNSNNKPDNPTLSYEIGNLGNYENVYVGFTAATGGAYEIHDIISWEFTTQKPVAAPLPAAIYLLGSSLMGLLVVRRRMNLMESTM